MSVLRRFPLLLFGLMLLSIAAFCLAIGSMGLLFLAGGIAVLSWYFTEGPRGRALPRRISTLLLLAAAVLALIDLTMHWHDPIAALGRFSLWLLLIKLFERRTARDHAHLLALSLLLMLVGCLKSHTLLFGALLLAYCALGLYVLLLYQLFAAQERLAAARPGGNEQHLGATMPRPTIGRHVTMHLRLITVSIGAGALILSTALFILFPRGLGHGMLDPAARHTLAAQRTTGYSDQVDLNGGTRITGSRRLTAEVRVLDADHQAAALDGPLLLRGTVLDAYDHGRWSRDPAPPETRTTHAGQDTWLAGPPHDDVELLMLQFRFHQPHRTVFSLDQPIGVHTAGVMHLNYDPATQTLAQASGTRALRHYTVLCRADRAGMIHAGADTSGTGAGWLRGMRECLRTGSLASDADELRALAGQVLDDAGLMPSPSPGNFPGNDPGSRAWNTAAARALAGHLRSGAYQYTLDLSDAVRVRDDPVADFLFQTRRGHCEYFASALVALCEAVEIPARLVTGYAVHGQDASGGQYRVLASDAHAWVEVRIGAEMALVVDPTPASVYESVPDDATLAQQADWLYQRLEGAWLSRFIGFDADAQTTLLQRLDAGTTSWLGDRLDGVLERLQRINRAFNFGPMGYIWVGIVGLAGLLAVLAVVKIMGRRRRIRRALRLTRMPAPDARQMVHRLGFYADMLDFLQRGGCEKPAWQPPVAFARRLHRTQPEAAALVKRLARRYYEFRYGGRALAPEHLAEADELIARLARALDVRP